MWLDVRTTSAGGPGGMQWRWGRRVHNLRTGSRGPPGPRGPGCQALRRSSFVTCSPSPGEEERGMSSELRATKHPRGNPMRRRSGTRIRNHGRRSRGPPNAEQAPPWGGAHGGIGDLSSVPQSPARSPLNY